MAAEVDVDDDGVAGGSDDVGIEDVEEDRDGGFDADLESVRVTGIAAGCFGVSTGVGAVGREEGC